MSIDFYLNICIAHYALKRGVHDEDNLNRNGEYQGRKTARNYCGRKIHSIAIEFDDKTVIRRESLNAFGFCQMAWKERRKILMKICPIDNAAVMASNEIFRQLSKKNSTHRATKNF